MVLPGFPNYGHKISPSKFQLDCGGRTRRPIVTNLLSVPFGADIVELLWVRRDANELLCCGKLAVRSEVSAFPPGPR